MLTKLTTKEALLHALTDRETFREYQIAFYYHFTEIVDVAILDDEEVMKEVVREIPHSYKYIKYTHLKKNRDLLVLALGLAHPDVSRNLLSYASTTFRHDPEIARLVVKQCPADIHFLGDEFKMDREFVLWAVSDHPFAYSCFPEEMKNDKEVIDAFIRAIKDSPRPQDVFLLQALPPSYFSDKPFVLGFITDEKTSTFYRFLAPELRKDREVAFLAARCGAPLYRIECDEVKDDFDIVSQAVIRDAENYVHASKRLKEDPRIVDLLLRSSLVEWNVYQALPEPYKHRKDILLNYDPEWVFFENFVRDVPLELRKDPEVIAKFGSAEPKSIHYMWHHGFYTREERQRIKDAIRNHDYETFMEIYKSNPVGLPDKVEATNEQGVLIMVDITVKENFMLITGEESEAG